MFRRRRGAILNLEVRMYCSLDDVGARSWRLIEEPTMANEIWDILLEEYDVDPER